MKINIARSLLILLTSSLLASCATGPAGRGTIAPEATALAKAVGEKLGAAQTIKLTATHKSTGSAAPTRAIALHSAAQKGDRG